MPDSMPMSVCVVSLTINQVSNVLPAELRDLLLALDEYNVVKRGLVYDDSRDEWSPYEDNKSIRTILQEAGLQITSYSLELIPDDAERQNKIIENVDLYIIDPLFLTLGNSYDTLIATLQGAINSSNKHFCILVPDRLPVNIRKTIIGICERKLPLLRLAYERSGRGEWEAEKPVRLMAYLRRIKKEMTGAPIPKRLQEFVSLSQNQTGQYIQTSLPRQ